MSPIGGHRTECVQQAVHDQSALGRRNVAAKTVAVTFERGRPDAAGCSLAAEIDDHTRFRPFREAIMIPIVS
jgi:hypothetical protein